MGTSGGIRAERGATLSKTLEVRLLGKFDVHYDGRLFTITSRPAQSLFAYLIFTAGTAHHREKLAGWSLPVGYLVK
jgi:hypothetical protein